jgi:hypothetical protein
MERLRLSEIKNNNVSINDNTTETISALIESLKKYGQIRAIVLDQDNNILDGHKLFKILLDLGEKECWVVKVKTTSIEEGNIDLNFIKSEIDSVSFLKSMAKVDVSKLIIPISQDERLRYKEMLTWDWHVYKTKIKNLKQLF